MSSQSVNRKSGASYTAGSTASNMPPDLKPWQRIDWPLCVQSSIFKEWGQYYNRKLLHKKAIECYGRAVSVCKSQGDDTCCTVAQGCRSIKGDLCRKTYLALDKRSCCLRSIAQAELAFEDAQLAHEMLGGEGISKFSVILNKCDALFDCSRFEDNLVMLHMEERNYQGTSIKNHFKLRKNRTLAVLEDTLGDSAHPFLLDNWPLIIEVARERRTSVAFMPQPLWQQLSESHRCDVESVIHKQKSLLSPLERARRRVSENVYNYHYLRKSANDVIMMHHLQRNKNFLNPLLRESTPYMSELATEQYRIVRKFMNIMHSRRPLYHSTQEKCRVSRICEKNRENYLYRVEHQTRRDCFRMLREVRRLRLERNIEKLTDYVEHIMATNIALKTNRTLPWKWEFVTEVYNILALAHVDRCAVPANINFLDLKNHALLYLLPTDRCKDLPLQFGGRNVYAEIARDEERINRVAKVERLEERLIHSRYAVERTYLLFEIARSHFKEARFDKSMTMAHRAVHEARSCSSIIWGFNGAFLICQVHAAFNRFERLSESLMRAKQLAAKLKAPKLQAYLALCNVVNDYQLDYHRKRHSEHSLRRTRRRKGRPSQSSIESVDNS